jgi:hypothetical protein
LRFCSFRSFFRLFQLLLSLPEFGQVEGCDLLGILDLLLEAVDQNID